MKVGVYYSTDDVRVEERPVPEIGEGEILVRMKASGICGTDLMQWYRRRKAPRVLGHEMAGEIASLGRGVERFNRGDRVFVSHHVPCYSCRYCRRGEHTACEALHKGNYDPGGFSEYIRVPRENVRHGTLPLPEGMTYEEATMIEPLGCVIEGQKRLALREGQTVLVIGSGVSGLLHIQLAKSRGLKVVATDINGYKLDRALRLGADHVMNAVDYSPERLKEVNDGRLAERVILCAGAEQAVSDAVSSVDRRGWILFFAVPEEEISLPSARFWRDEVTVTFSYGAAPEDLHEALELIKAGAVDAGGMITHRVPLSDIQRGFKIASEARESLKVVVVPDGE